MTSKAKPKAKPKVKATSKSCPAPHQGGVSLLSTATAAKALSLIWLWGIGVLFILFGAECSNLFQQAPASDRWLAMKLQGLRRASVTGSRFCSVCHWFNI